MKAKTLSIGTIVLVCLIALLLVNLSGSTAFADSTPQTIPFSQNWSNTGLITANDNWSGVLGITGYLGDDTSTTTGGTDPQTILTDVSTTVDVIANQAAATSTAGGVAEIDGIADPVVALQGSGTADYPNLVINLDTTGKQSINVSYNVRDVDATGDNTNQQVALQYRVGSSGNYTNLAAGYIADATTGPNLATLVTPVSVTLPAAADNQPLVQVRIITSNAASSDEWVGIDDISITGSTYDAKPSVTSTTPADTATNVATNTTIKIDFNENVDLTASAVTLECPGGTPQTFTGLPASNVNTVTLTPSGALPNSTLCAVTVVANQVTDKDGTADQMASDFNFGFTTVGAVDTAPSVSSTVPADSDTGVATSANVDITFSEAVNVTGTWFDLTCTNSGNHTAAVSGGPTTYTLNPDSDFVANEDCTVTVYAAQVTDQDANDPPDNMTADFGATFDTNNGCLDAFTPVYSIQGSGAAAAITGNVTTQGIVVGDFEEGSTGLQGFYLQDKSGDGDPATSDGIFVYTGNSDYVSAGDEVRVTGYARERFNQTSLNGSDNNNAAVPAANIVICGTGSITPTDVTMPFATLDYPERFEGMLVRLPQALQISEYFNYERFGEMVLALPLDGESRAFTPTLLEEPGAPAQARALANSLRRITLDDGLGAQNPASIRHPNGSPFALNNRFRGGDTVQNAVGVLGYDFNLYRIQPTGPADYTAVNARPLAPDPVGGSLRVASMNTLNFFLTLDTTTSDTGPGPCGANQNLDCRGADSNQPTEFTRQRDKLLAALEGINADIVGLNEIENTPGVDPLGDATNGIVAGLNAAMGPGTYASINTGVIGTDAIRVGLIYKPGKVKPVGAFQVLTSAVDPRFIDTKSRPVLAQTFEELGTGARFTVAVNHLKSKGSDCNDVGDPDLGDGQGNCNQTRKAAAQALVDWLSTDPTGSGDLDFLIIGDLNSYAKEDPIDSILAGADDTPGTGDDYTNLVEQYQGAHAYSYVFDGQAGYLDHALANAYLAGQVTGATEWHIDADEPDLIDYDTSFKPPAVDAIYEPNELRASDHDPVIVGLNLDPTCAGKPGAVTIFDPDKNQKFDTVRVDVAWSLSPCATKYKLVVRQDSKDGPRVDHKKTTNTTYKTKALDPGHDYYLRVKACNADGCKPSQWRKFSIDPDARPGESNLSPFNPKWLLNAVMPVPLLIDLRLR